MRIFRWGRESRNVSTAVRAAVPALLLFVGAIRGSAEARISADVDMLLDGVGEIAAPGVPGPLCVYGDAFAVVVGGAAGGTVEPVAAAAPFGAGKVLAFGHGGYFGPESLDIADTGQLIENAVRWAVAGLPPFGLIRIGVIGADPLVGWLSARGFALVEAITVDDVDRHHVVFFAPWNQSDAEVAALAEYARGGGTLILATTGWGWAQLHPALDLQTEFSGNRLLAEAGIQWPYAWLDRTSADGYAIDGPPSELTNGNAALQAVFDHEAGLRTLSAAELAQASTSLTRAATCAPPADTLILPRLLPLIDDFVVPSPEAPILREMVLERLSVVLQTRELDAIAPEEMPAHPAAAIFPGAVSEVAARVARTIEVDLAVPDWHSTGLYAAPGEAIRVTLPEGAEALGLSLRIGAHSDELWHLDAWRRMPSISRVWPLDAPETMVASPYGGLVYAVVPRVGGSGGDVSDLVEIEIAGAVEAPYFVLGKTDADTWRETIRHHPAPWAEVEAGAMIVTVPSTSVRELDDPEAVARTWDRVMELSAELAAWNTPRARPERFVSDEQISAGYMHAGYPLMAHLDVREALVDVDHLLAGNWGFYHEVGHNHQSGDWTFEGTVEVTVNLFTLYVYEFLCGIPVAENERGSAAFVAEQMAKYDFAAPDFDRWKSDPFLALAMYVQMQHAFGWDAYRRVFAEYRDLPAEERPGSDDEKRDQWLVRMSRTVGRDLGQFFEAWGVPTSPEARASLADLPVWLPEGFPPAGSVAPTATAGTATATPPDGTSAPTPWPTSSAEPSATGGPAVGTAYLPWAHGGGR